MKGHLWRRENPGNGEPELFITPDKVVNMDSEFYEVRSQEGNLYMVNGRSQYPESGITVLEASTSHQVNYKRNAVTVINRQTGIYVFRGNGDRGASGTRDAQPLASSTTVFYGDAGVNEVLVSPADIPKVTSASLTMYLAELDEYGDFLNEPVLFGGGMWYPSDGTYNLSRSLDFKGTLPYDWNTGKFARNLQGKTIVVDWFYYRIGLIS